MGQLHAVAGSKLYIGLKVAPKGEVEASDFAGQSWTEVGGWTSAGTIGDTQEIVTQAVINERRVRQSKGTRAGGTMENTFIPNVNDPGQIKMKAAESDCAPFAFKIEWGADCASEGPVTISAASPGVVTWPGGHGLAANAPVIFDPTGGDLPTGLSPDTVYYVKEVLSPTTFSVSATPGGTAINTTTAGDPADSIVATAQPAGQTDLFYGLVLPGSKSGGDANTPQLRSWSIAVDSNIIEV